jgi:hypothetical protein
VLRTTHHASALQSPTLIVRTPTGYAKEAYDRTDCGVWTAFITRKGAEIPSADLKPRQDSAEWAARNIVGIRHGTTVEGSDAEISCAPLLFPFNDDELADVWRECEDFANEQLADEDHTQDADDLPGCVVVVWDSRDPEREPQVWLPRALSHLSVTVLNRSEELGGRYPNTDAAEIALLEAGDHPGWPGYVQM